MKFSVDVESNDKSLGEVVEKAVAEYLWAHQEDYVGKQLKEIKIGAVIKVVDRPVDRGVS